MEIFELHELRLAGNGQQFDLSDDWARVVVDTDANGLKSWSVHVDNTNPLLAPDGSTYDASMVTTDGQRFMGTVWCHNAQSTLGSSDNAILLQGTGPLNGYVSP